MKSLYYLLDKMTLVTLKYSLRSSLHSPSTENVIEAECFFNLHCKGQLIPDGTIRIYRERNKLMWRHNVEYTLNW